MTKSIEFIFPMVVHSFIPPDRVFVRIEKELRKRDTIIIDPKNTLIFFPNTEKLKY
jgi:hypothetical protein